VTGDITSLGTPDLPFVANNQASITLNLWGLNFNPNINLNQVYILNPFGEVISTG